MSRKDRRAQQKLSGRAGAVPPPPARPTPAIPIDTVPLLQQQAMGAYQAGRKPDALAVCRQILKLQPMRADVMAFGGMIALELDRYAEAVELYRSAVAIRPDFAEAFYNLGNALMKLDKPEEAVAAYGRAASLRPAMATAHNNLGNALQALDRLGEAAEAYRKALAVTPDALEPMRNLGIVLHKAKQGAEAAEVFRRVLRLKPDYASIYSNLSTVLLEIGEAGEALAVCDKWLALKPGDIEALAHKAVALKELGDRASVRKLYDFDRLTHRAPIEVPASYSSLAEFNEALTKHVLAHPTLYLPSPEDPHYHHPALYITGELFAEPKGPMADLEVIVRGATERYLRDHPVDAGHPFLAKHPKRWRFTCWAAVLQGEGNLSAHVHLDGYLSGVYYPLVPDVVGAEGQGSSGFLELGRPPTDFHSSTEAEPLLIRPEPGLLVLFPAYVYHRTVPFKADQRRISIAFDMIPIE